MLAVPVAGRAWFRLNAEWVLPGVTVALVFLLGGTNARRNLQLACRPCNEAKAATAPVRDG